MRTATDSPAARGELGMAKGAEEVVVAPASMATRAAARAKYSSLSS